MPVLPDAHAESLNEHEKFEERIASVERVMIRLLDPSNSGLKSTEGTLQSTASQAALYHLGTGGNRSRARLCLAASAALGVSPTDAIALGACAELLHNASLIHDDLQDGEKLRRGQQTVWSAYSSEIAICTGDLMISCAFAALATVSKSTNVANLIMAAHQSVSKAIAGQCDDLHSKNGRDLTLNSYLRIVKAKSGALLALPIELPLILAGQFGSLAHAANAAEDFSVAYQIMDDIADREEDLGHPTGNPRLNIFLIESDFESVRELARSYFRSADQFAGQLPHGAGLALQILGKKMVTTL